MCIYHGTGLKPQRSNVYHLVQVEWFKEGQAIDTKREKKFSVVKKKSEVREGETIVQLEIKVFRIKDQHK